MIRPQKIWQRTKFVLALAMITMILMRLIWVQLRVFRPVYPIVDGTRIESSFEPHSFSAACYGNDPSEKSYKEFDLSPGFKALTNLSCRLGTFSGELFIRYNQNILFMVVMLSVMAARLLTGGWILPIVIGLALLSRGRFIAAIQLISPLLLINATLGIYFVFMIHFFRTGWPPGILYLSLICFGLGLIEPVLYILVFVLPLSLIVWRLLMLGRVRHFDERLESNNPQSFLGIWEKLRLAFGFSRFSYFEEGTEHEKPKFMSPLKMPLSTWILFKSRWIRAVIPALGLAIIVFCAGLWQLDKLNTQFINADFVNSLFQSSPTFISWGSELIFHLDLDLIVGLLVIILGAFSSRSRGIPSYTDICFVVLLSLVIILLTCFVGGIATKNSLEWFEPILLTLGIIGIFNIIKICDTYLPGRQFYK